MRTQDNYLMVAHITLRRFEYEEPEHLHLELIVSNGSFAGSTDFYCGTSELIEIGEALKNFPSKIGDEYRYVYGCDDLKDRWYRFFVIRTYTIDNIGHCAIQFTINLNTAEPYEGKAEFSIKADAASINRLGDLFLKFSKLEHLEFRWTPSESEIFAERQF